MGFLQVKKRCKEEKKSKVRAFRMATEDPIIFSSAIPEYVMEAEKKTEFWIRGKEA